MEAPVELELPGIDGRKGIIALKGGRNCLSAKVLPQFVRKFQLKSASLHLADPCQAATQKWSRVMLSPGAETKKKVTITGT